MRSASIYEAAERKITVFNQIYLAGMAIFVLMVVLSPILGVLADLINDVYEAPDSWVFLYAIW